jgi:hypothetical protein
MIETALKLLRTGGWQGVWLASVDPIASNCMIWKIKEKGRRSEQKHFAMLSFSLNRPAVSRS